MALLDDGRVHLRHNFLALGADFALFLEFAPSAEERPTYVGLGNTAVAPCAFGAPLLAGTLADSWGFETVFAVAGAAGLGAVALLIARVHDPRRAMA